MTSNVHASQPRSQGQEIRRGGRTANARVAPYPERARIEASFSISDDVPFAVSDAEGAPQSSLMQQ